MGLMLRKALSTTTCQALSRNLGGYWMTGGGLWQELTHPQKLTHPQRCASMRTRIARHLLVIKSKLQVLSLLALLVQKYKY
jgi:hypothetical protein